MDFSPLGVTESCWEGTESCGEGVGFACLMVQSTVQKQCVCGQAMVAGSLDTTESQLVAVGQFWGCSCWQLGCCSWDYGEAAWCCRLWEQCKLYLVDLVCLPPCWPMHLVLFETFCMPASDPYSNLINLWINIAKYKLLTK